MHSLGDAICNGAREYFGRRVRGDETRIVIKITAVQRVQHSPKFGSGTADIYDNAVFGELFAEKRNVNDIGGAMQPLRRAKNLAAKTVRDHDVVLDGDGVNSGSLSLGIADGVAQRAKTSVRQSRHDVGQIFESRIAGEQAVKGGVVE